MCQLVLVLPFSTQQLKRTHAHKTSSQLTAFPLSNELNSVNSALIETLSKNQLKFDQGIYTMAAYVHKND